MRTWARAPRDLFCGSCGNVIALGAPVSYWLQGIDRNWRRLRCVACADDAPPAFPDAIVTPEPSALGMARISEAAPSRTRGALRTVAREWTPYTDRE